MDKLDLSKLYKRYYSAALRPELVELEKARYLAIRGKGDPEEEDYQLRLEALFPVAYALKFAMKAKGKDFVVPKLEGQWWYDLEKYGRPSAAEAPIQVPRSEWEYRSLIRIPDFVDEEDLERAKQTVVAKKQNPLAQSIEFFEIPAGAFVQMLHLGPFSTEPESLRQLEEFIRSKDLTRNGHHQEIYLSDFSKTPTAKLRTILREPVVQVNTF